MKKSGFLPLVLAMLLVIMVVPAAALGSANGVTHDLAFETKTIVREEVGAQLSVEMVAVNPAGSIRTILLALIIVGFLLVALFVIERVFRPLSFPGREYRTAKKEGIGRRIAAPPWA